MRALVDAFGGSWRAGENPPDAYIIHDGKEIAVEISTGIVRATDEQCQAPAAAEDGGRDAKRASLALRVLVLSGVLLAALALFYADLAAAANLTGRVLRIHDGDTLTVLVDRRQVRVRLVDIDAPSSTRRSAGYLVIRSQACARARWPPSRRTDTTATVERWGA